MKYRVFINYTFEADDAQDALHRAADLVRGGYTGFDFETGDVRLEREWGTPEVNVPHYPDEPAAEFEPIKPAPDL